MCAQEMYTIVATFIFGYFLKLYSQNISSNIDICNCFRKNYIYIIIHTKYSLYDSYIQLLQESLKKNLYFLFV